jgi:hypothetical protein
MFVHSFINDEKLFPRIFHSIVAEVANEEVDICWQSLRVFCWNRDFMLVSVVEQHFQTSTMIEVSCDGLQGQLAMPT